MLGPFGQSASSGMSPQMLQQLVAMMQSQQGGNMRAPMANAAPQISAGGYSAPAAAAMMPSLQGPQAPQSGDTMGALAPYLALLKQQQAHAPGAMPGGVPPMVSSAPAPGYGPGPNATGPGAPANPQAQNPMLAWLLKMLGQGGNNPAYSGLPGQTP